MSGHTLARLADGIRSSSHVVHGYQKSGHLYILRRLSGSHVQGLHGFRGECARRNLALPNRKDGTSSCITIGRRSIRLRMIAHGPSIFLSASEILRALKASYCFYVVATGRRLRPIGFVRCSTLMSGSPPRSAGDPAALFQRFCTT